MAYNAASNIRNTVTLHFIVPGLWPQNSPDLIPVDYKVCGVMQERVYHRPILDVADVKWRLTVAWSDCSSSMSSMRKLTSSADGCAPV